MAMSLILLEQVPLCNSHWSVFNLQELTGSEELTDRQKRYLGHYSTYYLIFFWDLRQEGNVSIH